MSIKQRVAKVEDEVFKDNDLEIRVGICDPFPSEKKQIEIEEANPTIHYIWVVPNFEQIEYDRSLYVNNAGNTYRH